MADRREAHLFVLAGPDLARSFVLGERTTLGRSDECEVTLRDRSISRKHAVIVRQGEGWFVQDLGSTNGISKDGQRAERFGLTDGDEFKLGDLPLRFKLQVVAEEGLELDFAGPPVAAAPSVSAPLPRRSVDGPRAARATAQPEINPEPEVESELEVEEEIEIEGPHQPGSTEARPQASTVFRAPRAARRTGLFSGDLEQHPLWMRALLFLVLGGLAAALAFGVFKAVQMLRAGL